MVEKVVDEWIERNSHPPSDAETSRTVDILPSNDRPKTVENVTEIVEEVMKQQKMEELEDSVALMKLLPRTSILSRSPGATTPHGNI